MLRPHTFCPGSSSRPATVVCIDEDVVPTQTATSVFRFVYIVTVARWTLRFRKIPGLIDLVSLEVPR